MRFDEYFARLSADDFVDKLLVKRIGVTEVVVGYDFAFGRKGLGDIDLLKAQGPETTDSAVSEVGPVMVDGLPVSSTRVRQAVQGLQPGGGPPPFGPQLSDRRPGDNRPGQRGARLLGFPTANLRVEDELLPGNGVFAVLVERKDGNLHQGVTNIGQNPTFRRTAASTWRPIFWILQGRSLRSGDNPSFHQAPAPGKTLHLARGTGRPDQAGRCPRPARSWPRCKINHRKNK